MYNISSTTRVSKGLKSKIYKNRNYPEETFEKILRRMNEYYTQDDTLTPAELKAVKRAQEDYKAGRVLTTEQLNQKLGL